MLFSVLFKIIICRFTSFQSYLDLYIMLGSREFQHFYLLPTCFILIIFSNGPIPWQKEKFQFKTCIRKTMNIFLPFDLLLLNMYSTFYPLSKDNTYIFVWTSSFVWMFFFDTNGLFTAIYPCEVCSFNRRLFVLLDNIVWTK